MIARTKAIREIKQRVGEKEINGIVTLLRRWLKKNPKRAFFLRMYQKDSDSSIFIQDENGGDCEYLHELVESFLFDKEDTLHSVVDIEMSKGPLEERSI